MATAVDLHGTESRPASKADMKRTMGGASEADKRNQAAYEAGLNRVPEAEHFAGRGDVDPLERDSHQAGVKEARSARRRQAARGAAGHARSIAGTSGGYLAAAGRSVASRTGDIPTGGGGGSWVGVLLGVIAIIGLYLLLSKAGLAATAIGGITKGVDWLIAPKVLPF